MKNLYPNILSISLIFLFYAVSTSKAQQTNVIADAIHCSTLNCIESNPNKDATVKGIFRKYTPNKTGKGANHMFWDWELLLDGDFTVPVKNTDDKINYQSFEGKKVQIKGNIFFGIVIGDVGEQNAIGFRIDPVEIKLAEK